MKFAAISGTVTGSKTATIVKMVADKIKEQSPEISVEFVDLRAYDLQFCDGRDPWSYTGDTQKVIELLATADFFLIGTPIFRSSMTGALKNLFDLVPEEVFRNKVVGLVANGGTYQHYLVIENQLRPVASYFRCYVSPSSVYVQNRDFNMDNEITDPEVLQRLDNLAHELVFMQKGLRLGDQLVQ